MQETLLKSTDVSEVEKVFSLIQSLSDSEKSDMLAIMKYMELANVLNKSKNVV